MHDLRTSRRIMVVGCSGSGKSTLALALGERLNLPVIHLDQHYWRPGWTEPESSEVWRAQVRELVSRETWIMDGNYSNTWDIRLPEADTVIWLDFPLWRCLWRVLQRWRQYAGTNRPDIPEGCPEKIDAEFLAYIITYHRRWRPTHLQRLHNLRPDLEPYVIRTPREVRALLDEIR